MHMIKRVKLKSGPSQEEPGVSFSGRGLTVFVGPNNSGKSLLLRELYERIEEGNRNSARHKILDRLEPCQFSADEIRALLESKRSPVQPEPDKDIHVFRSTPFGKSFGLQFDLEKTAQAWSTSPEEDTILTRLVRLFTIALDGATRLNLVEEASLESLQRPPQNHLAALLRDDKTESSLAEHDVRCVRPVRDPGPNNDTRTLAGADVARSANWRC